jgi:hypothetical protein
MAGNHGKRRGSVSASALLAAASALGISLGIVVESGAEAAGNDGCATTVGSNQQKCAPTATFIKFASQQDKTNANQIKWKSQQDKTNANQIKWDSQQDKTNANQIKWNSQQDKVETNQIKIDQGK